MLKVFKPNLYSKSEFYKYMGIFFGEKEYKKELPYLINTKDTTWFVHLKKDKVLGFSSYDITNRGIELGETYTIDNSFELWESLASASLNDALELNPKFVYLAVTHKKECSWYLSRDFELAKTTTNYYFLERRQLDE
ncbi:hypothetical protein IW492_02585 [Enterococcus sp. BWB1-3]|uniref:hypothetical protein n=1 Tax=Enterococcus sp. BWB1-3 TaxID=2787713 RepID=UPI0019205818|nr:hypothetical protein [Enterococcus sp. BWB1-3]MBL1228118.1 hypothetical protein [Enterococcus sp. BWB1-3]